MLNETQLEYVRNELYDKGFITRNQCLTRYISRLSAIIFDLKKQGMDITTEMIETIKPDGTKGKDCRYNLR